MGKSIRRLGRGLDALVPDLRLRGHPATTTEAPPTTADQEAPEQHSPPSDEPERGTVTSPGAVDLAPSLAGQLLNIPIGSIDPNPHQPRSSSDDAQIASLAASIRESGLLQPVTVRPVGTRFEIITGERRFRAMKQLGRAVVPVLVRQATDQQMLELALIENLQREDLNAIDRARAYRRYCSEFHMRPDEVATRLGEDRSTVVNYLRLLELPHSIQTLVEQGRVSMGQARCLVGLENQGDQHRLAEQCADGKLSVRALEGIARRLRSGSEHTTRPRLADHDGTAHVRDMERRFSQAAGTKVTIREGRAKGRGRIVIEYYSLDDFDRIARLFRVDLD
jgi:ParB family chromosome partitioning protein